jgi:methionyl-tRNA formyltransferase
VHVVTDKHEGGSPVEKLAREHNLDVSYYPTIPYDLQPTTSQIGLCASFDHLIPQDVITQFGGNLYNLHPSLLPQYRNVSPVQYAIALGDKETGITLFRISPGIDDGETIAQASESILESDTTATLTPRLFAKGGQLFIDALKRDFTLQPMTYDPQPTSILPNV